MDATHLPAQIGTCRHCHLPLYADAPIDERREPPSHVACEVDYRRNLRSVDLILTNVARTAAAA